MERHASLPRRRGQSLVVRTGRAAGEDVGEPLDVGAGDDVLAALVLLAQAVDELGTQDVDLAVQDAALVGDLELLLGELLDQVLQLLVGEGAEVGEGVHGRRGLLRVDGSGEVDGRREYSRALPTVKLSLRVWRAAARHAVADVQRRRHEREREPDVRAAPRRASPTPQHREEEPPMRRPRPRAAPAS